MTVCEDDDGGDSSSLWETATFSDKVYLIKEGEDDWIFEEYKGNGTVGADSRAVTGNITNGQLKLTLGKPANLENLEYSLLEYFLGTVSPKTTRGVLVRHFDFISEDGSEYLLLNGNVTEGTTEIVVFIYVDSDCSINSQGDNDDMVINKPYNLELKTGWNSLHEKEYYDHSSDTYTRTVFLGYPNLKWTIGIGVGWGSDSDDDDYYYEDEDYNWCAEQKIRS